MISTTKLLIKIFQVAFMISVLLVFYIRHHKRGIRGYKWLSLTLVFGLIQSVVEYTVVFIYNAKYPNLYVDTVLDNEPISKLHHIPYAFLLLFLLYHFRYFIGFAVEYIVVAISMLVAYLTSYILEAIFRYTYVPNNPPVNDWIFMWIFDLYQLYIFTACFVVSVYMYIKTRKTKVGLPTLIFSLSFLVSFISSIVELSEHIAHVSLYGAMLFGISIVTLFLVYIIWPNYVYLTPIPVYRFLIIHETGTTMFSVQYGKLGEQQDSLMLGAAINAFTSFISDITDAPEHTLKSIHLKDRYLLAKPHNEIFGLLISEKNIRLFNNSLTLFVTKFYQQFKKEIRNFSGDTSRFEPALELLPKLFPYLEADKLYFI
ncbi:MAG: hypothetical protein ACTSUF_09265 [Candidatus Heimdallarchaeaceae archaeon]